MSLWLCVPHLKTETIAPDARDPLRTLPFLRHLGDLTDNVNLKQQIAETIAYIQGALSPAQIR